MVKRVCLVSGGTGGHLMPALVLARALRERGHQPLLVTEGREVEREFLQRESGGVEELDLPAEKANRLLLPLWLLKTTVRARQLLAEREVDCVVSTGGRPSVPMGLAAKSLGRPLFLLEQNAVPGRANRWLLPLARCMYLGLPTGRPSDRSLLTGTPLRPEMYRVDRATARRELGLAEDRPVVLVTGGSQGAQALNTIVPAALIAQEPPLQVLHLTGLGRDEAVRRAYAQAETGTTAIVRPVAMDMDRMLGAADLVICRGGGTTVAELMAAGRPALIVPYPHHRDRQQLHNAEVLARAGAARILAEARMDVTSLTTAVRELLADAGQLQAMGEAARGLCSQDPTGTILADMAARGGLG
ncbi:MAG: UDP-N-acetylglucosamine--N-acetylmuramyl-(pentapeptide) pyrophosphoryl-undecaprenol N-acetylglucosamine transferase [Planctomycetes bacterium]|nr:UDP-N-acetylglucosamine--N-acetylmuramyl-(pentapeptide) pyrophosphoryl-undecaprenol N-acetylglucosamine transferase [Planctomycetota bacterium]